MSVMEFMEPMIKVFLIVILGLTLLCSYCHDMIFNEKITTDRVSFIKHGNWKIKQLESKLANAVEALENCRENRWHEFKVDSIVYVALEQINPTKEER